MEKGTDLKTFVKVAEGGIGDIIDRCMREPEQRRFWWGYDFMDGGRLYIEYRRGHG